MASRRWNICPLILYPCVSNQSQLQLLSSRAKQVLLAFIVLGMVAVSPLWASPASLLNLLKGAEAITVGDASASLGAPFKLAATGSVDVAGTDITVRFVDVTEDSRCPSDVTCVWAGQVSVMLSLIQDSDTDLGSFVFTLGAGSNSSTAEHKVGDYVIKLIDVEPYPVSTHQIQLSEYVATLMLSKA